MTPFDPLGTTSAGSLGEAITSAVIGARRRMRQSRLLRTASLIVGMLVFVAAAGWLILNLAIGNGLLGAVPSGEELANIRLPEASRVLSTDGTQLGKYFLEERVELDYADISPNIVNALVATEDARFYEHDGLDLHAWARVAVRTLARGDHSSGGGSTISQQLIKNLYGRQQMADNPTLSLVLNKLREVYTARACERVNDKQQILALYLNTVPFPDNTYGIGVAAQRYFDKPASQLRIEEAATLVGSLKATYTYDPLRNPQQALYRRNTVLDLMAIHGHINPQQRDSLQELPLCLNYRREQHNDGLATHFREHARLELNTLLNDIERPDGRPYDIYRDGLLIETTLDAGMQAHAERAVREHIIELQAQFQESLRGAKPWEVDQVFEDAYRHCDRARNLRAAGFGESHIDSVMNQPVAMTIYDHATAGSKSVTMSPADSIAHYLGTLNAGLLVAEPQTGAVRAWVGGTNHEFFKYDKVRSRRSVGSTFKPIVYAAALQRGVDPKQYWGNYRKTYWQYEGWSPRNSGDEYGGAYNMRGGLTNSLNTISVQLMMRTGPKHVVALAKDMGIRSDIPAVPAVALGAGEVSLEEMLSAYGVLANRGSRVPLRYIARIRNRDGEVIYDGERQRASARRVLSVQHADLVRGMLESVVDNGTGRRLRWKYKLDGPIAGKTGTSQNHSDGWFIGFTPRLLAGVWTGAESPAVRFRTIKYGQGAHMALPIWGRFMTALRDDGAYADYLAGSFPSSSTAVVEALEAPMRYVPQANELTPSQPEEAIAGVQDQPVRQVGVSEVLAPVQPKLLASESVRQTGQPDPATAPVVQQVSLSVHDRAADPRN